eukprot:8151294-Pyramimonas_sp.AAC.2
MLDTQYRMHPTIAEFPAEYIYEGRLLTGITAAQRIAPAGFNWPDPAHPVAFVNMADAMEDAKDGRSHRNVEHARAVVEVVEGLLRVGDVKSDQIAVITPYQVP